MQKFYCDKCKSEMPFDSISLSYSQSGRSNTKVVDLNLCKNCKKELHDLLNGFISDFFGDDKRLEE